MSRLPVTATGENTSLADRKRRAGQRLILGIPGPGLDDPTRALIRQLRPAGFILFKRNVEEPAQVRELNRELAALLPDTLPALLSVDQEGGRVMRVRDGASRFPPLRWLGNVGDLALTRRYAAAMCDEVAALGFNLNWAPVADVDSNPANPVIGDRSFGRDPDRVAAQVVAWLRAAEARGIISCVKHFPGHGDTDQDSHHTLPKVEKELPDLERCELRPFRAAVAAGVPGVMSAHVVFPAIDEDRPATLSRPILRGWLREGLGFEGLVVSDDMEMKAVKDRWPLDQVLEEACGAGVDLFLVCSEQDRQAAFYEELVRLQERDAAQDTWSEDSERRLKATRERYFLRRAPPPPLSVLDSMEHRLIVETVRERGAE
ncbi:MAG: beta-N-acetylhexosaminidase [Alphaproteobacteria bacterium]|nr:beta-N-acetylhexosaminidase [Alphaproteobacteria bacterium]